MLTLLTDNICNGTKSYYNECMTAKSRTTKPTSKSRANRAGTKSAPARAAKKKKPKYRLIEFDPNEHIGIALIRLGRSVGGVNLKLPPRK